MLRKLTLEQITDWFTIGKAVTNVELLGRDPAAALPHPGPAVPAPPPAAGVHTKESVGAEYVEKYRQLEEQELVAVGKEQHLRGPVTPSPFLNESGCLTPLPVTKYKYPDLPIGKYKEEIVSLIESNSVVIVLGATGSGKSTQLPQYILDYYSHQSSYCNIVVTQPRKIGASSIARWISRERSWTLGGFVGYQVSLEKVATKDTRLIYMTTGVLLQKIVGAKSLTEFTHIFIDEVHERTEEMDFLLLVVRKLLRTNSRFVKVILMSATINCKEFMEYFSVPIRGRLSPAHVFKVEGKPHAIEEYYLDDLKHITRVQLPLQSFEQPMIAKEMYEVAICLIQMFSELEMKDSREYKNVTPTSDCGSVLVFLPGLAEINYMHELLSNMVHKRLQVYPLHSSVTLEEQNNVFLTPVPGYRKIILSTNIAESSLTVPDIKYVIDFCLTRTLVCDEDTKYQSLRLCWASQTNCNQRKGRAGRVSRGYCYRLVSKHFWINYILENAVPEMLRCPLGSTILKVKLLDMGEPRALLATALSPPGICDIEHTILQLKEIGALAISAQTEEENPYDGELTFLGRVLAQLPVDQHLGKLIVLGHVFGCLEECLIIAAALSLKNFFAMPFRQLFDGYRSKIIFSGNSKSDCIAFVKAFKAWQTCRQRGQLRHPKEELDWGRSNYIQIKRIREVAELFEELKNRIKSFNMHVNTQPPAMDQEYEFKQRFILQIVIAGAFYPNYFSLGQCDEEIAVKNLTGRDPKTTIMVKNIPPYGFLYHKQLQSLFRQCGQVKSIAYDEAKAFVEFSRNPMERFKTLPAVYLALKMSQLRVPLELKVHFPEEIERKMEDRMFTSLRHTRVNVDFQKQTVDPLQISFSALEESQTISGLLLSISVTEVVEVGHFWGYRIDENSLTLLQTLADEISRFVLMPLPESPHPDLVCLAPFPELENKRYYRARILYVSGDSAEMVLLQALEFKICKMRPSAKSLVCGEQWSYGASQRFTSLVNGCALIVKVYSVVHSILHVNLYCHSGIKDIVNIRDVLIREGYAEVAEESYQSKVLLMMQSYPAVSSTSDAVYELVCASIFSEFFICTSWLSLCCKTHFVIFFPSRTILIDKESVNSVIVHDTPADPFQQMLVAASLSVNATGSTMLLRETTFMPPIPGLPALLCMLFAPVIELRVDKDGKNFTGVLCGLGWNQTLGTPVLPEHEMELAFDVHFDVDDIVEINILRTAINKLVCYGPNVPICHGEERISQLQENARQKLLSLICKPKPREVITPKWYEKSYEWNQVDSKLIIDQSEGQNERGRNAFLYQLHKLVVLNT
ncbi:PREDICTED: putative ATP-dependent RNA helicase TDRD9 [Crocodylus porosus]|uniref:putative ATP-dependent RNA helicase TDRD9 n=1 Tax=Crocodylus porosus TaxID=8502 RepID=UPI000938D852|nr:PREDICTED: putative ATP-dependent RNA helicase TDRD9 [Crocodylus porosus]